MYKFQKWTCAEKRKTVVLTEVRTPSRPDRSKSLYRLRYPSSMLVGYSVLKKRVASNVPIVAIDVTTSGPLTVTCD